MSESSKNALLGALDLLILQTLSLGSNHGFGITLHVQTVSEGLLRVEEGSLYPALHRLERHKLVRAEWKVSENGRRARYYTLTDTGFERLEEVTAHWERVSLGVSKLLAFAQQA